MHLSIPSALPTEAADIRPHLDPNCDTDGIFLLKKAYLKESVEDKKSIQIYQACKKLISMDSKYEKRMEWIPIS